MPKVQSATDIARALTKLGVSLDEIDDVKAKHTKDPSLAKAVKNALAGMSSKELKNLRAAVGTPESTALPTGATGGRLPLRNHGTEPRVDENTPVVAALLASYGVDDVVSRPLERVLVHIAKIDTVLRSESDPALLADAIMAADLRRHVFLVEGWARLYSRIVPEARDVEVAFKELEDVLGAVSATRSNLAFAVEKHAPASVVAVLEKERDDTHAELVAALRERFTPAAAGKHKGQVPAVRDAIDALRDAKLDDYVADRAAVKHELARRLEKVADASYDMNDLQGGLHELRRQLRWFPIFTEALNGLVQLDPTLNPVKAYEPFLTKPLATSKYLDIPDDSREARAFHISKSLYCAVIQLTLDLGALKDSGEPMERLMHAYVEAGLAQDLVDGHRMVARLVGGESTVADIHTQAQGFYADMRKNRLIEKLAATFTRK